MIALWLLFVRCYATASSRCGQLEAEDKVLERLATSDRVTIVVERLSDGKIRVTSNSWNPKRVLLRN